MSRKRKKDKTEKKEFIDPDIAAKDIEKDTNEAYKKYRGIKGAEESIPVYIPLDEYVRGLRHELIEGFFKENEEAVYFIKALSNARDPMRMRTYMSLFNALHNAVIMGINKHTKIMIENWLKGTQADVNEVIEAFKQCHIYVSTSDPDTYMVTDFFRNIIRDERLSSGTKFTKENFKGYIFFIVLSNVPGCGIRIWKWISRALIAAIRAAREKGDINKNGEVFIKRLSMISYASQLRISEKRARDLMYDFSARVERLFDDLVQIKGIWFIKVKPQVVKIIERSIERTREEERKRRGE